MALIALSIIVAAVGLCLAIDRLTDTVERGISYRISVEFQKKEKDGNLSETKPQND